MRSKWWSRTSTAHAGAAATVQLKVALADAYSAEPTPIVCRAVTWYHPSSSHPRSCSKPQGCQSVVDGLSLPRALDVNIHCKLYDQSSEYDDGAADTFTALTEDNGVGARSAATILGAPKVADVSTRRPAMDVHSLSNSATGPPATVALYRVRKSTRNAPYRGGKGTDDMELPHGEAHVYTSKHPLQQHSSAPTLKFNTAYMFGVSYDTAGGLALNTGASSWESPRINTSTVRDAAGYRAVTTTRPRICVAVASITDTLVVP